MGFATSRWDICFSCLETFGTFSVVSGMLETGGRDNPIQPLVCLLRFGTIKNTCRLIFLHIHHMQDNICGTLWPLIHIRHTAVQSDEIY